jgi:hypothetical protein
VAGCHVGDRGEVQGRLIQAAARLEDEAAVPVGISEQRRGVPVRDATEALYSFRARPGSLARSARMPR